MQPKVLNDQFSSRIRDLVDAGYSVRRIAAETGLSYTAVRHRLRVMDLVTLNKPIRVFRHTTGLEQCLVCNNRLGGLQTKYCSRRCLERAHQGNSYEAQKDRANARKALLIKERGGKCQSCGYSRNLSALCFHHILPSTKSFSLDGRGLSNHSMESIRKEVAKCALLCANCHLEHHHPELTMIVSG